MLEWILIAVVIAVIFGVIKIDDVKKQAELLLPKLKELFAGLQAWSKAKAESLKAAAEQKKAVAAKEEKSDDKPAE